MSKSKVLLIGWDAADWNIIWPLINSGKMPALKSIMDRGVYGNMSTLNPPYSPMLWSTVATGKTPDKHGVLGFMEVKKDNSGVQPVTASSRKSRALWNIFTNQGIKSNLINWWPSFPAEPIDGHVVTDKFNKVDFKSNKKSSLSTSVVCPNKLTKEIEDLRMFPSEVTEAHVKPFIPDAVKIDQSKDKKLNNLTIIVSQNVTTHAVFTYLIENKIWDFTAVYYDMIDHFCHGFIKYHPPKISQVSQEQFEIYKDVVNGAYRFQDMMLERTLELVDDNTTIIIMSDHGYESGDKRILKMPKYQAAPALEHRQFGVFVAAGPRIKKNQKIYGLGLIDVAPTILHMFGLPVGKDMDGKVLLDIFKKPTKPNYISTWEEVKGDFGQLNKAYDSEIDDGEMLKQLADLGYIEKPDADLEIAVIKTKCDLKHNLARVKLTVRDIDSAKNILISLVEGSYPKYKESHIRRDKTGKVLNPQIVVGESVVDLVPYYMDLLKISVDQGSFEEAERYLRIIKNLDKTGLVNPFFAEAKILLANGKVQEAVTHLEDLIKFKPGAEAYFQLGKIKRRLSLFNESRVAFEKALDYENDSAKTHQALAEVLIRENNYEEAIGHALVAIELIKYFPDAHYTLGEALEKSGDLKNAKIAYETASKLTPKSHFRAKMALENIEDYGKDFEYTDKNSGRYYPDQITVVSGLPRSGTSMMMQMLEAGGLDLLTDGLRQADESNPKGYYEYDPVMSIRKDNSWLCKAQNKGLKVVAPLLKYLNPEFRYKIIFMTRDLYEIVKSQQIMIGKDPDTLPTSLLKGYKDQLRHIETWKMREPGVELIYLGYSEVLGNPKKYLVQIEDFLGIELDKLQMESCIDETLYRNRLIKTQ